MMSRNAKIGLIAVAMIGLILLAGQCAYSAGEWVGKH
jgi:hypothetical protein